MWLVVALSLYGNYLNVKRRRASFLVWMAANVAWIAYNISIRSWAQAGLFGTYLFTSAWGWVAWGDTARKKDCPEERLKETAVPEAKMDFRVFLRRHIADLEHILDSSSDDDDEDCQDELNTALKALHRLHGLTISLQTIEASMPQDSGEH